MELEKFYLSKEEFISTMKLHVFNFNKMSKESIDEHYSSAKIANRKADEFIDKNFDAKVIKAVRNSKTKEDITKEMKDIFIDTMNSVFRPYNLKEYGFCLKSELISCACEMIANTKYCGFITKVEEERFVWVDFGDVTGSVKIDVEELNIAKRVA